MSASKSTSWINMDTQIPSLNSPCEYIIEVKCKGWFNESNTFTPANIPPEGEIIKWKPWENSPPKPEDL